LIVEATAVNSIDRRRNLRGAAGSTPATETFEAAATEREAAGAVSPIFASSA